MDDDFASFVFTQVPSEDRSTALTRLGIRDMAKNKYDFSALLLAPPDYHSEFKGRLDAKRDHLVLCIPIHRCEFSGDEPVDDFCALRMKIVPTMNWQREVVRKSSFAATTRKHRVAPSMTAECSPNTEPCCAKSTC